MLKEKWWKQKKGGGKCKVEKDNAANELNLKNVGGVFLVLVMGLGVACVIVCMERCFSKKAPSSVSRVRLPCIIRQALFLIMMVHIVTFNHRKQHFMYAIINISLPPPTSIRCPTSPTPP